MTQAAATALSLIGLAFTAKKLHPGPMFGLAGSVCWVLYALETRQWGLMTTELAFVGAYLHVIREWGR